MIRGVMVLATAAAVPLPAAARAVPVSLAARPAAPAGQQVDARAEATRLAAVMLPEAAYLGLLEPMFEAMLEIRLSADPVRRKYFADRPELRVALRQSAIPAMQAMLGEALPRWRAELRDLLMTQLSGDEARSLADFLSSPAGQKLYVGAMTYAAHHPELDQADDRMMRDLMATMTPEDMAMLDRFATQPVALKFSQITSAISPMMARWGQDLIREQGPRLKRIIDDAMAPYVSPGKKP